MESAGLFRHSGESPVKSVDVHIEQYQNYNILLSFVAVCNAKFEQYYCVFSDIYQNVSQLTETLLWVTTWGRNRWADHTDLYWCYTGFKESSDLYIHGCYTGFKRSFGCWSAQPLHSLHSRFPPTWKVMENLPAPFTTITNLSCCLFYIYVWAIQEKKW